MFCCCLDCAERHGYSGQHRGRWLRRVQHRPECHHRHRMLPAYSECAHFRGGLLSTRQNPIGSEIAPATGESTTSFRQTLPSQRKRECDRRHGTSGLAETQTQTRLQQRNHEFAEGASAVAQRSPATTTSAPDGQQPYRTSDGDWPCRSCSAETTAAT